MRSNVICAISALLVLAGCSGSRTGAASEHAPDAFPPPFARHIAPFEVRDATGTPYDHPFLGGLNVPRPQFVDIDADGDLDLFVQEVTGQMMFFEHVGTPDEPQYVWRTDHYNDIDVGEWYRFVDLDEDGDYDLLGEQIFSYVRFFRNEGTPQEASFTLAVDSLRDDTGTPIFVDRQNIPNLTDLDCDGLLDFFIGRVDGTVVRYESVGMDDEQIPRFKFVTDRFEDIEIVAQIGTLHGANTMFFNDIDHDGDKDLFWGDFFEPGLLMIRNTGTCASPVLRDEPTAFPLENPVSNSGYNDPTFADIDGDGDQDLFLGVLGGAFNPNATAADNFYFLEVEDDRFTLRTERFLTGIDVGSESIPAFADLDADGDLDMLLTNKIAWDDFNTGRIFHFENQGTPEQPSFQLIGTLGITGSYHYAPALADLDADGDLDMLVGESSGELNFYRNTGTPQAPTFVLETDNYDGIDVGRRSYPTFLDFDHDGDQDMIVGREALGLAYFRNDGTPQEPAFVADSSFALPVQVFSTPSFPDIDNDGDVDFFTGGAGGGVLFYKNRRINVPQQ